MKKILVIIGLAFMLNNLLRAQDLLVFINGDEIPVKVLEVGSQEIKIKKWDNLDGPTYTYKKTEIFMIKYETGEKHIISTHKSILLQNDYDQYIARSNKYKKRGIILTSIGGGTIIAGVTLFIGGSRLIRLNRDDNEFIGGVLLATLGIVLTLGSTPMMIIGPINLGKSTKFKRMALEANRGISVSISPVFNPIVSGKSNSFNYQGGFSINVTF